MRDHQSWILIVKKLVSSIYINDGDEWSFFGFDVFIQFNTENKEAYGWFTWFDQQKGISVGALWLPSGVIKGGWLGDPERFLNGKIIEENEEFSSHV